MSPQNKQLKLLLSEEKIAQAIAKVAEELNALYQGKALMILCVLKGSFMLVADLIRLLNIPVTVEFIRASSYGMRGITPGELSLSCHEQLEIEGKELLIIDDICDTGATLKALHDHVSAQHPASLRTLVLLKKEKKALITPTWTLFTIGNGFVVGFGLDYCERYRELPALYELVD